MTFRASVENNPFVWLAGVAIAAFTSGFAAYQVILDVSGQHVLREGSYVVLRVDQDTVTKGTYITIDSLHSAYTLRLPRQPVGAEVGLGELERSNEVAIQGQERNGWYAIPGGTAEGAMRLSVAVPNRAGDVVVELLHSASSSTPLRWGCGVRILRSDGTQLVHETAATESEGRTSFHCTDTLRIAPPPAGVYIFQMESFAAEPGLRTFRGPRQIRVRMRRPDS